MQPRSPATQRGHLPCRLSRQAITSSSPRTASWTRTTEYKCREHRAELVNRQRIVALHQHMPTPLAHTNDENECKPPSGRNPNLTLHPSFGALGRRRVYGTPKNPRGGACACLAGKHFLPNARNKTLRPCRVRHVFFAKLLDHHPLLHADAKRAEDRERDQVRRTCYPIRDDERLADGIQC